MILDLGCGCHKVPESLGLDESPDTDADIICDLNKFPYPLADSKFSLIYCNHIIEHIDNLIGFFREVHRIGKPGGIVKGITPHFSSPCSYADPTHRHHLSIRVFEFLCQNEIVKSKWYRGRFDRMLGMRWPNVNYYTKDEFRSRWIHLEFSPLYRRLGIQRLANHDLDFYEFYLAGILPSRDIHFELEIVK